MAIATPSPSYSITLRLQIKNKVGMLGKITSSIGEIGGDMGAIDIVSVGRDSIIRDLTVNARDEKHAQAIIEKVKSIDGISVVNVSDRTFLLHIGGKIQITNKFPLKTRNDLSMAYTPGVARVCMAIHYDKEKAFNLTIKKNTVAIVSDGTAVLGLGDIGPEAAMPVMEGKAMLFKEFGDIDAFPICLNTKDVDEIVKTVKYLEPTFGGINLEDISAPRCFEIEERLKAELSIPVFHDDQHGTSVVVLAALLNALKIVKKELKNLKVVVNGVGAAGMACSKIFLNAGIINLIGCDRAGIIYKGRKENMNPAKEWFSTVTNPFNIKGTIKDALKDADIFLGLSGPGAINPNDIKLMNKDAIVFALANPTPEVMPEEIEGIARVIATGRSDYTNQINNVLCFPGIFRGALDSKAETINEEMKLAAAYAIASVVSKNELSADYIIPSVFNKRVAKVVAAEVMKAAHKSGVSRKSKRVTSIYHY